MTNRVRKSCNNLLSVTDLTSLGFCHLRGGMYAAAARRYTGSSDIQQFVVNLHLEIFVVDAATLFSASFFCFCCPSENG